MEAATTAGGADADEGGAGEVLLTLLPIMLSPAIQTGSDRERENSFTFLLGFRCLGVFGAVVAGQECGTSVTS